MPTLQRDGTRLWWDEGGDGEPLLLVQGLGYASDMWYRLLPALESRHRVLRLDNRGVGRSDVPDSPVTIETMAADALAVLDAAQVPSAHVFGVSMGGLIAQELALAAPDRVRSLVLGCTHPGGSEAVMDPEVVAFLKSRSDMTPEQAAEASVPYVYAPDTPRSRIDEDLAVRLARPTSPAGYTAQVQGALMYGGTTGRLPALRMPVLLVHGTVDRLVPVANVHLLARELPHARLHLLDGASHVFWTDQPEASADVILGFLAEVEQGGP